MNAPGQLDMDGGEQQDPRLERIARALWYDSAKRTWGENGRDVARENATRLWPRMRPHYLATAKIALAAIDKP